LEEIEVMVVVDGVMVSGRIVELEDFRIYVGGVRPAVTPDLVGRSPDVEYCRRMGVPSFVSTDSSGRRILSQHGLRTARQLLKDMYLSDRYSCEMSSEISEVYDDAVLQVQSELHPPVQPDDAAAAVTRFESRVIEVMRQRIGTVVVDNFETSMVALSWFLKHR